MVYIDRNIKEIINTFDTKFKSEIQEKRKPSSKKEETKLTFILNPNTKTRLIKLLENTK